jgi:metal-responsive CopG/Arc/MetJ family transcriptional regulator
MKSYKELNKPDIVMISLKLPRYLLSEIDRLSDGLSLSRNKFIVETLDARTKSIIKNQTRLQLVAEANVIYNSSREALADFDAINDIVNELP